MLGFLTFFSDLHVDERCQIAFGLVGFFLPSFSLSVFFGGEARTEAGEAVGGSWGVGGGQIKDEGTIYDCCNSSCCVRTGMSHERRQKKPGSLHLLLH